MVDLADAVVWTMRLVLAAGLGWGAWLCVGHLLIPAKAQKLPDMERFATFALIVLLLTTVGGFLHG